MLNDMPDKPQRSELPEWKALEAHKKQLENTEIKDLFASAPDRFDNFHLKHENLLFDYSKQGINADTIAKLSDLAKACDLEGEREKMFCGEKINVTEGRAALHTALRSPDNDPLIVDGENITPKIKETLERIKGFSTKIRAEKKFTHIVNIGVGGSDLGPYMAYEALKHYSDRDINFYFVSNIDASHLMETLRLVDPEKTLFIVTSKTFTTKETIANARSAKKWMQEQLGKKDISEHFIAASANIEEVNKFGIKQENIFPLWDWVGGRFSIWSSVGISFCIAIGFDNFNEMLKGAHSMDKHFCEAPLDQNMPAMLAMIGVWHRNFLKLPAISVTPYNQYLSHFCEYLQQLDMESNGKGISRDNISINYDTGPILISDTGTNAQHAYFQTLHQGTTIIPCDFIMVAKSNHQIEGHHDILLANAIAQTKALMDGEASEDPQKSFTGNRPSNTIIIDELTPYNFGMLLALYEHKIFVQGIIWNINSFDQCGVELGKTLANKIVDFLKKDIIETDTDSSTLGILKHIKDL